MSGKCVKRFLKCLFVVMGIWALFFPQIANSAPEDIVFKTSFEKDLNADNGAKITLLKNAKVVSETAIHGKKSLDFPEINKRSAMRIEGVKLNWKQGAVSFSFKLRKIEWRIFCCINAQQKDQAGKLGFSISSDGKYFLFGCGNKDDQRAYFKHAGTLKPDVWHRALFFWETTPDGSALVKCYIDGKPLSKKGIVIKKFLPGNFTEANPAKITLGQYHSLNGEKGFNGYLDAFIIYNTPRTP